LVVGRSWGQGAQHSQSLQSTFSHFPGLTVIMPSHPDTILSSYLYAAETYKNPVISIEHRLMYELEFTQDTYSIDSNPLHSSYVVRKGHDITVVATSIMVLESLRAAEHLFETAGISCEVIDLHSTSHPQRELVIESVRRIKKLIIADTSWQAYGVGAEVCRWILEEDPSILSTPVKTIGMAPAPCPTAKSLEDLYYPNLETLSNDIAIIVTGKIDHGIELPAEKSMADIYKRFKGPF
jgi:acetoin:2,6-dichlorophenolindophenol oxidoreductase subunit beta